MGRLEAALGFGWGAGAFIGGFLVLSENYGSAHPSVILSFLFTASIGVFAVVGYMGATERIVLRDEVDVNFRPYFWKLSRLFATTFILFTGYMFFLSFSPIYLTEITGSSYGMGIIVLLSGVVHALAAPYAGKMVDKYPREFAIRVACTLVLFSMIIYSITENVYLVAIAFILPIYMTFFLGARSIVADTVPYQLRARTMGLLSSFSLLGSGFGSILVGELLLYFNYQTVFQIGAILSLLALLIGWKKY